MRRREMLIIMLLVISLVTVSLYQTYATDVIMNPEIPTDTDLSYTVDITDQTERQVTVSAGATKIIDIFLTNKNNGTIKYGVGYTFDSSITSDVTIKQSSISKNMTIDTIEKDETKQITIEINNNSSNQITVDLVTLSGYENGGDLIVPENINLIDVLYKDPSGANRPELMSGMVPVEYKTTLDGVETDGWYVADETKDWYSYGEQRWANAVLVTEESELRTASAGTPVPENSVLAYYVWIPRYKYQLFNANKITEGEEYYIDGELYDSQNKGINIKFENNTHTTGEARCTIDVYGNEICQQAENGNWYTHPAFWWDKNGNRVRETNEELTGIWVGKFEISSETPEAEYGGGERNDLSVRIKPNVSPWGYNTVSNFFTVIRNMSETENIYGINSDETNSHMLKNMEWGAVAYFTHSKFGRCPNDECTNVDINADDSYYETSITITGGVGEGYVTNVGQSTTNNITGIYDIAGGADEYVMGNIRANYSDSPMRSGRTDTHNSGFKGLLYDGETNIIKTTGEDYPDMVYYNVYSDNYDSLNYTKGHLGDATVEIVYYNKCASFVHRPLPWFARGGNFDDLSYPDVFHFSSADGGVIGGYSTRAALIENLD